MRATRCLGEGSPTVQVLQVVDRHRVHVVQLLGAAAADQEQSVVDGSQLVEGPRRRDHAGGLDETPLLADHVVLVHVVELALVLVDASEDEQAVSDLGRGVSVPGQRPRTRDRPFQVPVVADWCQ